MMFSEWTCIKLYKESTGDTQNSVSSKSKTEGQIVKKEMNKAAQEVKIR